MEILRTCNAGVLLTIDGVSLLLDGLCDGEQGYLPTPPKLVQSLLDTPPDLLIFTHSHPDHYSRQLLLPYQKQALRPIFGPESVCMDRIRVGEVTVTGVQTRHLGKTEPGLQHRSFVIEGSRCVWYMGDASPMQLKKLSAFPKPDVLIVPYAYANTASAWEMTKEYRAQTVVLLHLPDRRKDPQGLWQQVQSITQGEKCLYIPEIGETKTL